MTADVLPAASRRALAQLPDMIRAKRARDGLSQRSLAELLGVSNATPSRLESGCPPDLPILLAVLAWLDVPLSWFDGRSGQADGYRRGWDDCEAVVLKALAERSPSAVPDAAPLPVFGLRDWRVTGLGVGEPWITARGADLAEAWPELIELHAGVAAGDEVVRRDRPGEAWRVVGRVGEDGSLIESTPEPEPGEAQ